MPPSLPAEVAPNAPQPLTVEFLTPDQAGRTEIAQVWRQAVDNSANPRAVLQSEAWFRWKNRGTTGSLLMPARDQSGRIVSVSPLRCAPFEWVLYGRGDRAFSRLRVPAHLIVGNLPLLPHDPHDYATFFNALRTEARINAVYTPGVAHGSAFHQFIIEILVVDKSWIVHPLAAAATVRHVKLSGSFDEYLSRLPRKLRQNLQREIRVFREYCDGDLTLERTTEVNQVAAFLDSATKVAASSWQKKLLDVNVSQTAPRYEALRAMASEGHLRSYVLKAAGEPCGFTLGLQSPRTFFFYETAYDPKWARFSPGKVMFFLMLQDLFQHKSPELAFLAPGDFDYKRWFGTGFFNEAAFLILKNTFANRMKISAHHLFRNAVQALKRVKFLAQRSVPDREPLAACDNLNHPKP